LKKKFVPLQTVCELPKSTNKNIEEHVFDSAYLSSLVHGRTSRHRVHGTYCNVA